jgi:hypothetical protein
MSGIIDPPVHQSGVVTPRHFVVWTTDGVIQDAGDPVNPFATSGIGIQSSNDTSINIVNAPVSGPYNGLSLGITPTAANLTVRSFNGAPDIPFNMVINGVVFAFPDPGLFLPLNGGTMLGPLILAADPVVPLQAATKQYVDGSTQGYLFGLTLSNNLSVPDILLDIAPGACADSVSPQTGIITLGAFTKSIGGTWVAGSGQNGLGPGVTTAPSIWLHVFAAVINGLPDVYYDTSVTGVHFPVGTTLSRRIGAIFLDAATHITRFSQNSDRFDLLTPELIISGVVGDNNGHALTVRAPPGAITRALLSVWLSDAVANNTIAFINSFFQNPEPASTTFFTFVTGLASTSNAAGTLDVVANVNSQIRFRLGSATAALSIVSNGWMDTRGK